MSPFMIILLILIFSIQSSRSNDSKRYEVKRSDDTDQGNLESMPLLEGANVSALNGSQYRKLSSPGNEKLRNFLESRMRAMVENVMQRQLDLAKKWNISGDLERTDGDNMVDENGIASWEFLTVNDQGDEAQDLKDYRYNVPIGRTSDGIGRPLRHDFIRAWSNLMPVGRRNFDSNIHEVRAKFGRIRHRTDPSSRNEIGERIRGKRTTHTDLWIRRDFKNREGSFNMHALVVRDEDIPPCCSTATEVTTRRYFMCSGAVLTLKHAITTASCMHFADIYNHEIEADLGILVGATNPRAYVIKINRYEMHPNYDYIVESKDHATHNVAIIFLECSIVSRDVAIPLLPKGINDDVAHMCCGDNCDLFTIVQSHDNRHAARIMKAKHLPAPRHIDEVFNDREILNTHPRVPKTITEQSLPNETFVSPRRSRSPPRLAKVPFFFGKEVQSIANESGSRTSGKSSAKKKRKKVKMAETTRRRISEGGGRRNDLSTRRNSVKKTKPQAIQTRVEQQLAAVDWEKIEDTMSKKFTTKNRQVVELFAKNVVDETIKRLENVLADEDDGFPTGSDVVGASEGFGMGDNDSVFGKLMPSNTKNKTLDNFVKVFTDVVTSLLPPNEGDSIIVSTDTALEEKDLDDPSPIYEDCPPLGAPIIVNETLIGLVAYTCDDAQNWVEWKYVSVSKNLDWLRRKISEHYEPAGKCSGTGASSVRARSLPETRGGDPLDRDSWTKNRGRQRDKNDEWTSGKVATESRDVSERYFGNVRMAETFVGPVRDPWFVRNSQTAPQERFNRPRITVLRNVPVHNYDTCYVTRDGTIDCGTRLRVNRR